MIAAQREIGTLLVSDLAERLPGAVRQLSHSRGECYLHVEPSRLLDIARFLKEEQPWQFAFLANLSPVDWLSRTPRFEVVYHLRSLVFNYRVGLKVMPHMKYEGADFTLSLVGKLDKKKS